MAKQQPAPTALQRKAEIALQQRQAEMAFLTRMKTVEEAGKSFRTVAVFGCAALMFYFCASMVHDLAGKKTAADIGLQFLGTLNVSEGLAWAIAAICGGIVFKERRTSRSMAKRLGRMADFERAVDPNRSSSHLTATGTPREEDL